MAWLVLLAIVTCAGAAWALAVSWSVRRKSLRRLRAYRDADDGLGAVVAPRRVGRRGGLRRWLDLAGYRGDVAAPVFLGATGAAVLMGALGAWLVSTPAAQAWFRAGLGNMPGGLGDALLSVVTLTPWLLFLGLAAVPALVVRAARRERVNAIEQDLPLTLELYATLAEAGLGFDAATSRILESQPPRPLARELRAFQRELLGGIPRVQALRNIARRLEVGSVTVFISALVQAEQVGASVTETLRRQADDLRDRRRQRALTLAQALPVKLVFPLVTCFLPGIFLSILGPAIQQLIQVVDSVLRGAR